MLQGSSTQKRAVRGRERQAGRLGWAASNRDKSDATWALPLPSGTSKATELWGLFSF